MAEQKQVKKQTTEKESKVEEVQIPESEEAEKLKAELDEILDEIDSVLEENAQDFVNSYIQKGGQ